MHKYLDWLVTEHKSIPIQGTAVTYGDIEQHVKEIGFVLGGFSGGMGLDGVQLRCSEQERGDLVTLLSSHGIQFTEPEQNVIEVRHRVTQAMVASGEAT